MPRTLQRRRSIRDVMTPEPVCVGADSTIRELMRILREHDVSGAPVVGGDGRLVGVASITDVFRRYAEALVAGQPPSSLERFVEGLSEPLVALDLEDEPIDEDGEVDRLDRMEESFGEPEATVEELMTPEALSVPPDEPVAAVGRLMAERGVHRVIVVDASGFPIGIATTLDLLRAYPEEVR